MVVQYEFLFQKNKVQAKFPIWIEVLRNRVAGLIFFKDTIILDTYCSRNYLAIYKWMQSIRNESAYFA